MGTLRFHVGGPLLLASALAADTSRSALVRSALEVAVPLGYLALILVCVWVVAVLVLRFLYEIRSEDAPRIDTHWGGFGGGMGGWSISRSLVYLLGALLFMSLGAVTAHDAALTLRPSAPGGDSTRSQAAQPKTTSTATPAPTRTDTSRVPKAAPDTGKAAAPSTTPATK